MKSRFFLCVLFLCPIISKAQLYLNQYGNVSIGLEAPLISQTKLCVGIKKVGYGACFTSGDTGALYFKTDTTDNDPTYGILASTTFKATEGYGIKLTARGTQSNKVAGIHSVFKGGKRGCGVMGGLSGASNMTGGVGIFGSTSDSFILPNSGTYAGYFYGDVRVLGTIYGTVLSPSSVSGGSNLNAEDENIETMSEDAVSVIENLQQVELLKMTRVNNDGSLAANKIVEKPQHTNVPMTDDNESSGEEVDEEPIQTKLSSVSYSLAANQLKQFYPELVYEDQEGNYSINYIEMVPLLVQSIKELSAKVETLEQQLGVQKQTKKVKSETTGIENNVSDIDMVRMDQNKPNPFSESTVIGLNVPEKTQKADIFIYDLSGKQIKSIPVSERGETNITLYASSLNAGMYIYTLVTDGKVVVTRRMIVEK